MQSRSKRWMLIVGGALLVLAVLTFAAMHFAARSLKESIEKVLGPESTVADLDIGLTRITIRGLKVRASKDWPTDTALSAERVVITPNLRQLVSGEIEIRSIVLERAYVAAARSEDGGGIKILPGMARRTEKRQEAADEKKRGAEIGEITLQDCTIEFHDRTATGWKKLRIENVEGKVNDLQVPALTGRTKFDLKSVMKGPKHTGSIVLAGWVDVADKGSDFKLQIRNIDLALFEPYVVRVTRAGIDRGTFNLDMHATVSNNVLHAPGTLTLAGLELKTGTGAFSGLSNIPRRAVLAALADDEDRATIHFELKGSLDNPSFSLTDSIARKAGAAMFKALGLSFEGLVRALLIILGGFGGAVGGALENS